MDGHLLDKISTAMVHLAKEHGGKGPTKTQTHWAGQDALVVIMGGGFTTSEETIYRGGHGEEVRDSRHAFNDVMEGNMRTTIEGLTGRAVSAFISGTHQDPDLTVLLFVLEPEGSDGPGGPRGPTPPRFTREAP
ncbi:MAG TPA: Na-translocating system protein MpsC family protein [Thermoleophilaceae bacterium]|nr:Na-translocating system protein MpsC family protein [Thermoleophilaceae bacterium]